MTRRLLHLACYDVSEPRRLIAALKLNSKGSRPDLSGQNLAVAVKAKLMEPQARSGLMREQWDCRQPAVVGGVAKPWPTISLCQAVVCIFQAIKPPLPATSHE